MDDSDSTAALSFDSEHRLRSENLPFDIDVWYNLLRPFTFETVFLPLRIDEASAIKAFHDVSWRNVRKVEPLTASEVGILRNLEREIDSILKTRFSEKGAFLRLCGRSPKDAEPLNRKKVVQTYADRLKELIDEGFPLNGNTKMIAIARSPYLNVSTGEEAMQLLLTSERVLADITDWLKYGEPDQIVLRKWDSELTIENEFRAFIHAGRLNAVSQYDHYAYYPELHKRKDFYLEGVFKLWSEVQKVIGIDSYVIDIAYLPVSDKFVVVEISPFTPCTGPSLFHWGGDKDILEGRRGLKREESEKDQEESWLSSIEFRLKREDDLHPQIDELVELQWESRWNSKSDFVPFYEYYRHIEDGASTSTSQESNGSIAFYLSSMFSFFVSPEVKSRSVDSVHEQDKLSPCLNRLTANPKTTLLFLYGTLKKGFQWNEKYLSRRLGESNRLISEASTKDKFALLLGESGVPYLLQIDHEESTDMQGSQITEKYVDVNERFGRVRGEVWEVSSETLKGLDDYEGVGKGYYSRIGIKVILDSESDCFTSIGGESCVDAQVYVLNDPPFDLNTAFVDGASEYKTADGHSWNFISEYTSEMHESKYNAIRHISVKQEKYYIEPSSWGKTLDPIRLGLHIS